MDRALGIIAPSSQVPRVELKLGVHTLREAGFQVKIHPQCFQSHLFFAGTDEERGEAFFEFAHDKELRALWCARGGYGAIRLLPLLDAMTRKKGVPSKKLLIGYSDATALMEFVRQRWGWSTLHAPMPSFRKFSILPASELQTLFQWIRGCPSQEPWSGKKLSFLGSFSPKSSLVAPLVGGNLTVWSALLGSSFEGKSDDCILFLEDVDESLYRIDRMLHQLLNSKTVGKVKGIILGNFLNCRDYSPLVLKKAPSEKGKIRILKTPRPQELRPLRKVLPEGSGLCKIFSEFGLKLRVPVAFGLPVGHGPEMAPLPLGAIYQLSPQGELYLRSWDWMGSSLI